MVCFECNLFYIQPRCDCKYSYDDSAHHTVYTTGLSSFGHPRVCCAPKYYDVPSFRFVISRRATWRTILFVGVYTGAPLIGCGMMSEDKLFFVEDSGISIALDQVRMYWPRRFPKAFHVESSSDSCRLTSIKLPQQATLSAWYALPVLFVAGVLKMLLKLSVLVHTPSISASLDGYDSELHSSARDNRINVSCTVGRGDSYTVTFARQLPHLASMRHWITD